MLFTATKSILITIMVSAAVAWAIGFTGTPFTNTFIITIIGLFIAGFFIGQVSDTLLVINNKKLENERIKEFTKQGVYVECAFCSHSNFVPIRFDVKNEFNCDGCNKKNAVYLDITTTQTTTPIDTAQLQAISEEEEVIDKIRNNE
jgi:hypothetical protein